MWKSKMGKEGNLKTLACPLCPACHFALPVRTKKLFHVMCHQTQTEAGVLPITSWLILCEVLITPCPAIPWWRVCMIIVYLNYSMIVHTRHKKNIDFSALTFHRALSPTSYYQPVTLCFGKWQRDETKQLSLSCEEASKCLLKCEVSKCQLTSSSLTQGMMFL